MAEARLTSFPNGISSFVVDSNAEIKNSAYTVIISTDSGKTFTNGATDGVVFTLPVIAIGNVFTFINTSRDGLANFSISPNALDAITYDGSEDDDKDLINTKATAKYGDYVTLASLSATGAWQVVAARGVWAKEA